LRLAVRGDLTAVEGSTDGFIVRVELGTADCTDIGEIETVVVLVCCTEGFEVTGALLGVAVDCLGAFVDVRIEGTLDALGAAVVEVTGVIL